TGDTLLIRGTGRTDFQNGSARAQYESIFNRLLKLPEETFVFPAHDYKGDTVSTIGEEKRFNPRLQVRSADEYVELMSNLKLPNPKMMDVAVPANMHVGLNQDDLPRQGRSKARTASPRRRRSAVPEARCASPAGRSAQALDAAGSRGRHPPRGRWGPTRPETPVARERTLPGRPVHRFQTRERRRGCS